MNLNITNSLSTAGGLLIEKIDHVVYHCLSFEYGIYDFSTYEECGFKFCSDYNPKHYTFLQGQGTDLPPLYTVTRQKDAPLNPAMVESLTALGNVDQINLWVSRSFNDHVMVAQILKFFPHIPVALHAFYDNWSTGEIPSEKLKESIPQLMTQEAKEEYLRFYALVCSSDLDCIESSFRTLTNPLLKSGVKEFYGRLPMENPGINSCDLVVLKLLSKYPNMVHIYRIIGETMIYDRYDRFSEFYIQERIERLINASKPCIEEDGAKNIKINDFGHELLLGRANWLEYNTLQDQVGGIVLDSRKGQFTFQESLSMLP